MKANVKSNRLLENIDHEGSIQETIGEISLTFNLLFCILNSRYLITSIRNKQKQTETNRNKQNQP
jgi:hypothetical protein